MKGHSPGDMQAHNYGMPSPAGYRTAHRLFQVRSLTLRTDVAQKALVSEQLPRVTATMMPTGSSIVQLAERFSLPVVTLVDTVGAWPSFPAEQVHTHRIMV